MHFPPQWLLDPCGVLLRGTPPKIAAGMGPTAARCGLLLLLAPSSVQPRRARGLPPSGVVRTDALGSQAWEAEASLSASECASIRSASGVAKDGGSMVDYAEQSGAANTVPQEVRSTQLQWLGVGRPDIDALREKLFSVAKRASRSAGWSGHGRLRRLQNLQLGTYLAEEGGHYTWHPGKCSSTLCVLCSSVQPHHTKLLPQTRAGRSLLRRRHGC